jgi:hypothetical protein
MFVMATKHILPEDVHSPKQRWSLIKVLHDGGPGNYSVALGKWDNEPVLGMRWNGTEESPIGNPQSRGLPTWFIVPDNYQDSILEQISKDMISFVKKFFEKA